MEVSKQIMVLLSFILLFSALEGCIKNEESFDMTTNWESNLELIGEFHSGANITINFSVQAPDIAMSVELGVLFSITDPDNNTLQIRKSKIINKNEQVSFQINYLPIYLGNYTLLVDAKNIPFLSTKTNFTIKPYLKKNDGLPDKWAIIVGMEDYPPEGPGGTDLRNLANSTKHIYRYLTEKYSFPPQHILYFANETATHDAVLNALKWLTNNTSENSTVVFVYSGHGSSATANKLFSDSAICTYDKITWGSEMKLIIDNIKYKKFLINIDACVAGSFSGNDQGIIGQDIPYFEHLTGPGRIVTTASTSITLSWGDIESGWGSFSWLFWKKGLYEDKGDSNLVHSDNNGEASAEEAWWYTKTTYIDTQNLGVILNLEACPTMNDQYDGDMYL